MSTFLMSSAVASRPKPNVPAAAGFGAGPGVGSATGDGLATTVAGLAAGLAAGFAAGETAGLAAAAGLAATAAGLAATAGLAGTAAVGFAAAAVATEVGVGTAGAGTHANSSDTATAPTSAARPLGRIVIADRSVRGYAPVLLPVVVIDGARAAHAHQVLPRGLHVARLIGCAARQDGLGATPGPREQEGRVRHRQHRIDQPSVSPRLAAVGTDLNPCDPPPSGPGDAADFPWALGGHHPDPRRRPRDRRLRFHGERELASRPIRHRICVLRRLLARLEWLIAELEPSQPLDVDIAFPARQHEPRRVALLRPQRLAVLAVGNEGVVQDLVDGHAARENRRVFALGQYPLRAWLHRDFVHERRDQYARPVAGAGQAVQGLRGARWRALGPAGSAVAGALQEHDAAHRRKPLQVVQREHRLAIDHAVERQRVAFRVDQRNAGVMALVVNVRRRDDAVQQIERRQ